jgi:hypothetical protein
MQQTQQIKYREIIAENSFTTFVKKSFGIQNRMSAPRITIEKAYDSIGNETETNKGLNRAFRYCKTNCLVSSSDILEFVVQASNSGLGELEYALDVDYKNVISWQKSNKLNVKILEDYVSKFCQIRIKVRDASRRWEDVLEDNIVIFSYNVRPKNLNVNSFSRYT